MWSDMNEVEKQDFIQIGVAWVIGMICLAGSLAIIDRASAPQEPAYEIPCRTVGHMEVSCD